MRASKELSELFARIRDIPYYTSDSRAQSCFDKRVVLKGELEARGYACRLMIGRFRWSDLRLPSELMALCEHDAESHVFLRANMTADKWVDLDPTIDAALGKRFRVEQWDGASSTGLLTLLTDVRVYLPLSFWVRARNRIGRLVKKGPNAAFYEALDDWLGKIRDTA